VVQTDYISMARREENVLIAARLVILNQVEKEVNR
jgi:hypothetical protein